LRFVFELQTTKLKGQMHKVENGIKQTFAFQTMHNDSLLPATFDH
jgi:hypothetical protein